MKVSKKMFALLLTLALALPALAQKAPDHAGTWWKEKSEIYKEAYIAGYKTGAHQEAGHDTSLSKFGAKELTDGLNHFYADFRNRNISINDSIFYVADQLAGVPDEKLNAEILKMRAAAVGVSSDE
jgi:hypothetical protein